MISALNEWVAPCGVVTITMITVYEWVNVKTCSCKSTLKGQNMSKKHYVNNNSVLKDRFSEEHLQRGTGVFPGGGLPYKS